MKKKTLNDRLAVREKIDIDKSARSDYSASFRRQFKDYVEFSEYDERGRKHVRRVYQGVWHIPNLPAGRRKRERWLLALLFAGGLVLFLLAALRQIPANRTWLLAVAHVITVVLFLYTGSGLFNYLTGGAKLTTYDYETGPLRFRRGCLITAGALALCALLYLACVVIYRDGVILSLLAAGLSLAGAFSLYVARMLDGSVPFIEERSREKAPDDAVRIE